MNIDNWLLFISIAFIATSTPGPAVLLVTANSLSYGYKKSVITILGNITGLFFMSALSILGLSAIILSSAAIFLAIKTIGALYLMYLGLRIWINGFGNPSEKTHDSKAIKYPSSFKLYRQGLLIALSNPKVIAFTTALFPQFIDPNISLLPQFMILVITFMFLSFICLFAYAIAVKSEKFQISNFKLKQIMGKLFGTMFIGYGLVLASTTRNNA